jgi:Domain of unknown function (DUF4145)
MPQRSIPASIREVAFDCPHCGAYTTQTWLALYATMRSDESRTPTVTGPDVAERIRAKHPDLAAADPNFLRFFEKAASGLVFLEELEGPGKYVSTRVHNLNISKCFVCDKISVWVYDRLVFPGASEAPTGNPDLPEDVRSDYEEAGRIVNLSPRGAAALLRLAIQKICAFLGEKGKSLDDDIAGLMKRGLPSLVQQALDAVRVIGNEAVHPGTLDLKDDRDTAMRLFGAVNIIVEQMISNPKHVAELYESLPEAKRQAIEKRDSPE